MDLKSGYWQVEIQPEDREKTAFTTGKGLWQFKVMPFGLCNTPATLDRLMETVFRGLTSEACLVYLDDIIIVGRTFEEHLNNIRKVFKRLQKANLKLSPKKFRFFRKEVSYLGHIISADGVKTDPEEIKAVVDWPRPETVHDLRSFPGLCTFYRHFRRKGTSHGNADALSRRPCKESCKQYTNAQVKFGMDTNISFKVLTSATVDPWSSCEIQKAQLEDPAIKPILEKKLNSADRPSLLEIAPESHATKRYWALWDSLPQVGK
ncbi:Retrovirus-related Pol polyprotein from transposon 297 [Araneus ventricosus]|uniref:Retrovirus-related Pol polyprotein from transposon 297 n=1 Tax=Araneus ventricosus TaxID=182803 RepID=A0A4Y2N102_ARAVE|nr:Retrovirus-related Pol polyprotein from transposon 297 [Araneus ventricosus]